MAANHSNNQTTFHGIQNGSDSKIEAGGQQMSVAETYLIGFMICIGIIGMIGNFTVLLVVKRITTQKVKFLISSQAMIDCLTSFVLVADTFNILYPSQPPRNIVMGYLYCCLWNSNLLLFGLFNMSTWNLVAISIERSVAVINPMWYRVSFSEAKAALLGLTAWVIAPTMQTTYVIIRRKRFADGECTANYLTREAQMIVGIFIFLWDFFLPCIIMGVCFTCISFKLMEQDRQSRILRGHISADISTVSGVVANRNKEGATTITANAKIDKFHKKGTIKVDTKNDTFAEVSRSRSVTQTFVIIFVVFVICWITNQCLFLQYNLGGYDYWSKPENYFANSMAILNSVCNPFIYVLHVKTYRQKLRRALFSTSSKSMEMTKIQSLNQK